MNNLRPVIKKYKTLLIYLSLPLQIIIVQLISLNPELVERFYTGNFYKKLSLFLRLVFGEISIPVGQILFYSLVTGLLVGIKKTHKKGNSQTN